MADNDNGDRPTWMEQMDGDLKENETLAGFESISDLGKGFLDHDGRLANSVQLLGENSTDEDRATFYDRLGRPKTPDEYGFKKPENLPEGMPYDEARATKFAKTLYDMGASKDHGTKMFDDYHEDAIEVHNDLQVKRKAYHDAQVQALRSDWGDDYEPNAEMAIRVAGKIGGEDFTKWMDDSGLGDQPLLIRFCHSVAQLISEDDLVLGDRSDPGIGDDAASVLYPEMKGEGE